MSLLAQGLMISLSALTLTFAALGLFILIIITLEKLLPADSMQGEATRPADGGSVVADGDVDTATAAAISVAVAVLRRSNKDRSHLGSTLSAARGRWWDPGVDQGR